MLCVRAPSSNAGKGCIESPIPDVRAVALGNLNSAIIVEQIEYVNVL